jgi:hypothetical protein
LIIHIIINNNLLYQFFIIIGIIAKQNIAIWVGIHCGSRGARHFLGVSPPRSAFQEIRVAGFAADKAAREASLGGCTSTSRWLPAWARNNLNNCNIYLFEHLHTSISVSLDLGWRTTFCHSGGIRPCLNGQSLFNAPARNTKNSLIRKCRSLVLSTQHKTIPQKLYNINCKQNLDLSRNLKFKPKYASTEIQSVFCPETIGLTAKFFDNYPRTSHPELKATKDENRPTILP